MPTRARSASHSTSAPPRPASSPGEASPDPRPDVYRRVTDQILEAVQAGVGAFRMPWHFDGAVDRPVNVLSRLPYRGANTLLLWTIAQDQGYTAGEWGTYPQWRDKGAQVRKGEKATHIVFWKFSDRDADGTPAEGDMPEGGHPSGRLARLVLARTYPVFNADQVDGYERRVPRALPVAERIAHADEFLESSGVTVLHGGGRAFYSPKADHVVLPRFEAFKDPISYYAVRAHETIHATGHPSRLDRQFGERYGTDAYAMEELTAELGAAFVCADLNLVNQPRPDHAQYVATWLKALRDDPRALFTAAGRAQRAADWLHDQHVLRFMPEENYDQIGFARRGGPYKRPAVGGPDLAA